MEQHNMIDSMREEKRRVVVMTAGRTQKEGSGYLLPIAIVKGPGFYTPYPQNETDYDYSEKLFVPSRYEELSSTFSENELFIINTDKNAQPFEPYKSYRPTGYCTHVWDGGPAEPVEQSALLHVVEVIGAVGGRLYNVITKFRPTRYLLLKNADVLIGPFKCHAEIYNDQYRSTLEPLPPNKNLPLNHTPYIAYKFGAQNYSFLTTAAGCVILSDLSGLFKEPHVPVDFMSDEQLIKWAKDLASVNTNRESARELNALKQRIRDFGGELSVFDKERSERLVQLIDRVKEWDTDKLFVRYIETDNGKKAIDRYLDTHGECILESAAIRFASEFQNIRDHIDLEISDLNKSRSELKQQCTELTAERAKAKGLLEAEIEEQHKLKSELDAVNQDVEVAAAKLKQLDVAYAAMQKHLSNDKHELAERIADLKPLFDILVEDSVKGIKLKNTEYGHPTPRISGEHVVYPFLECTGSEQLKNLDDAIERLSRNLRKMNIDGQGDWLAAQLIAAFAARLPVTIYGPASMLLAFALGNALFGGKAIYKPISRLIRDTSDLFGKINPVNSTFVPDPDRLADLLLTHHTSGDSHLVIFEGFNRCDGGNVFAPIFESQRYRLPIVHSNSIVCNDSYSALSQCYWPTNMHSVFVYSADGDRPTHWHWANTVAINARFTIPTNPAQKLPPTSLPSDTWNIEISDTIRPIAIQALTSVEDFDALSSATNCDINPDYLVRYCSCLIALRGERFAADAAKRAVQFMVVPCLIDYESGVELRQFAEHDIRPLQRIITGIY